MRPIIKWTMWQRKWSIFWWTLGIAAFNTLSVALYPSLQSQSASLNHALDQLPQSAKALFAGGASDLLSPVGYYNSKIFYLFLPLLLSALTIGLGSSLIAKEESDGTLELLLARPISRGKLLVSKVLAGLIILLIVSGINCALMVLLSRAENIRISLTGVAVTTLAATLLSLLFGSIAFFIACLGRWGRNASLGIAVLVALGSYLITSLSDIASWLQWPAKFLPYHYYKSIDLLSGTYDWTPIIAFAISSIALGILAWLAFRRRDLG